jgi:uncharacterized metal-binding protein YceD (DUF177 family)
MSEPLTWSHRTAEVPEAGLLVAREATPAEREAIAGALDIISCDALSIDYAVRALGGGRYRMMGKLTARVTQACVVTLEPVAATIAQEIDVAFWPAESLPRAGEDETEVLSVAEIEPIEHGQIEVGRVLYELLSASLDPYPRKPGARFEWEGVAGQEDPGATGPFAGLRQLKNKS